MKLLHQLWLPLLLSCAAQSSGPGNADGPQQPGSAASEVHAQEHREFATLLTKFEVDTCGVVPEATCPLLQRGMHIEDMPAGVILRFLLSAEQTEDLAAHMRCHHAFGRSRAFRGMSACPLYLEAIQIEVVGPGIIQLRAAPAAVAELQRRAHHHDPLDPNM